MTAATTAKRKKAKPPATRDMFELWAYGKFMRVYDKEMDAHKVRGEYENYLGETGAEVRRVTR